MLAIRLSEISLQALLRKVLARQFDRRGCDVDAGNQRTALREADEVRPSSTTDFENPLAAIAVKRDKAWQMMQLFEVILIEVGEEARRAQRVRGDFEVVNVPVPVVLNVGIGGRTGTWHGGYYISPGNCR